MSKEQKYFRHKNGTRHKKRFWGFDFVFVQFLWANLSYWFWLVQAGQMGIRLLQLF